uniref:Uncharacterized protein n=1 Tax=Oryza meridionalis TaxID=40149 RepID=A0A0E0CWF0_9ORYZ
MAWTHARLSTSPRARWKADVFRALSLLVRSAVRSASRDQRAWELNSSSIFDPHVMSGFELYSGFC